MLNLNYTASRGGGRRREYEIGKEDKTGDRTSWEPGGRKYLKQIQYNPMYSNPVTTFLDRKINVDDEIWMI